MLLHLSRVEGQQRSGEGGEGRVECACSAPLLDLLLHALQVRVQAVELCNRGLQGLVVPRQLVLHILLLLRGVLQLVALLFLLILLGPCMILQLRSFGQQDAQLVLCSVVLRLHLLQGLLCLVGLLLQVVAPLLCHSNGNHVGLVAILSPLGLFMSFVIEFPRGCYLHGLLVDLLLISGEVRRGARHRLCLGVHIAGEVVVLVVQSLEPGVRALHGHGVGVVFQGHSVVLHVHWLLHLHKRLPFREVGFVEKLVQGLLHLSALIFGEVGGLQRLLHLSIVLLTLLPEGLLFRHLLHGALAIQRQRRRPLLSELVERHLHRTSSCSLQNLLIQDRLSQATGSSTC
mmetsp:Transcript_85185/g.204124  ORF Transcript_85185/g.204124 Transcript_85185/m.204124 type:complete len:344 (+) Transcript_85185:228-1259(+)